MPYNWAVLILALDTSSSSGSLAILRDNEILGVNLIRADERYSSSLFHGLDYLMRELCLSLSKIDLFAVVSGPGSFTGLRVGLTAVKGWAEAYSKQIAAISGLEAVAAQPDSSASIFVPVLDARRGQIYFAFYRRGKSPAASGGLELEGDECLGTPEEFLAAFESRDDKSAISIITPDPTLISSALSGSKTLPTLAPRISIEQVSPVLAPFVGQLGRLRAQRGELADALSLGANYIRRCDAELHWKDLEES